MPVKTIAVMGGVTQDLTTITDRLPDDGETVIASSFTKQPGGKGANSAVATYRLTRPNPKNNPDASLKNSENDIRVRMVGAIGTDEFGPALKENLISCGVNADGVRVMEGKLTGVGNILVEAASGANRIMQYPGAAYALEPADFMTLESLGGGVAPDFVISQLEIRRDTIEQAIETAHREGIEVLLNPSPARYLMPEIYPMISHLIMNEQEAVLLSQLTPLDVEDHTRWTSIAEYFLDLGVKNVVITLGEKGAYYSSEVGSGYVEAEKNCTVLDTSGAGDSFVGGYAAQYMAQKQKGQWDIKAAVQYGCKASARVIEYLVCLDPIPWADEVDTPRYLNEAEKPQEIGNDIIMALHS